jgi:hypothetical protein
MIWFGDMLFCNVADFPKCSQRFPPNIPDAFYRNRQHCQLIWTDIVAGQ